MRPSPPLVAIISGAALLAMDPFPVWSQGTQAPPYRADRPIAIVGGLLIDGTGAQPRWDQTVLIQGDRITQIGPSDSVTVPAGVDVIWVLGLLLVALGIGAWQGWQARQPRAESETERPPLTWWLGVPVLLALAALVAAAWATRGA